MYKLVAIDLDGTLLNSQGAISEKNKQTIKRTIQAGIKVILASGRPIMSVKNMANEIGANEYIICGNGSTIYDLQKGKQIYNRFLNKKKVLQIIKICEENSIFYNVYTEDTILAKSLNYNVLFYAQENLKKIDEKKTNISIVENIYSYIENSDKENFLKITICDEHQVIFGGIMRKLKKIKKIDVLEVAHMSRKTIKLGTESLPLAYYYTEITSENVDKWNAILYLINELGIKPEEVMAIGDNSNDKTMLEQAGLGVAMGNSAPYIKSIADLIVPDNNSDGVSQALEYILK